MKTQLLLVATLSVGLLSGCASNGKAGQMANDFGEGVGAVAKGIGDAIGGFGQPYTNGVQVTEQQLAQLEPGMSQSEVEQIIGFPPEIQDSSSGEIWSYPYTEITHFSGNTNETTVVRFNTNGKLAKAYKTNSRNSSTGNPLVDAANGTN
jgi:outer membrane protein assembly factor BamE (lipoprotein component of BamABCDE complex)